MWNEITFEHIDLAINLVKQLWHIYRIVKLKPTEGHLLEPKFSCLEDRPSMILRHLCSSLYLNKLVEEEQSHLICHFPEFMDDNMGSDCEVSVFERRI